MKNLMEKNLDLICVILLFVLTNILTFSFQEKITYRNGHGWDGVYYYQMAEQFAHHEQVASQGPFIYRVGPPFLAAWIDSNNLNRGFLISNLIANVLSTLLMIIWFRYFISEWWIRVAVIAMFLLHWLTPVRYSVFYPFYNEPWPFVFIFAAFIFLQRIILNEKSYLNLAIFTLIIFVGTFFRETMGVVAMSLFFIHNPIPNSLSDITYIKILATVNRMFPIKYIIPFFASILATFIVHRLVIQTDGLNLVRVAFGAGYSRALFEYTLSWFISYGPILALCIYSWRTLFKYLWNHQHFLFFFIMTALAGWVGGWDIERYLLMGAPVFYLLIGLAIKENSKEIAWVPLLFFLVVMQAISERVFWSTPDYFEEEITQQFPFLTVMSNRFRYFDLFSTHGKHFIQIVELFWYGVVSILIIYLLKRRKKETQQKIPSK